MVCLFSLFLIKRQKATAFFPVKPFWLGLTFESKTKATSGATFSCPQGPEAAIFLACIKSSLNSEEDKKFYGMDTRTLPLPPVSNMKSPTRSPENNFIKLSTDKLERFP
jgi:hypothetical protein